MKKILVVCLGNICRSPTAEAVLRATANKMNVEIEIDSAGTINHHQGNAPDSRSMAAGEARGYSFKGITSRQVQAADFEYFDLILAADKRNIDDLNAMCPTHLHYKIALFLSYAESNLSEIPDPYYGGEAGFELVLDLLEDASTHLLNSINSQSL
ncbi:low molecular weight protein-tyrosine-phosphatase [Psychromonas sp. Urea-02u-13]|uniref:low molecular weight protein-tyrosine-phosphatase n=1 Tax=Psychromonas sp. Urea-02u-13 TaxID=2058326 RepID=UPI000C345512|nr:low molecular weight protein-tyrosine-phosphatase [Psychromonas sp. Urea-02u-13]PKG40288.1 protein-tyrosine-phosphatase [Psychromonas sp. Urea-02u-13]